MKLAVLMDPIDHLTPYKDTTIGMIKSAARRGWSCFYFTPKDITTFSGECFAKVSSIQIGDVRNPNWVTVKEEGVLPLSTFDILLLRKDPPFDMEYIYSTYAMELVERTGVLVANKPQSLRDANEKFFTQHFPQCIPPTLVSKDMYYLKSFWKEHKQVIFKPLEGMGGASIFYVGQDGINLSVIIEELTKNQTVSIMAQGYIPDIKKTGDKRIILINGEPIPYALARIPADGELRGNLRAGGKGNVVPINDRDRVICQEIAPTLRAKGLYFVGIDVIGHYLTEINVTSPTCAIEIEAETGIDITGKYLDCLEELRNNR